MPRIYTVPLTAVAVSAAQDVYELLIATNKPVLLHEIKLFQTSDFGDAQAEGLGVTIKKATGSYTSGSGGTTPTPAKHSTNDVAAGFTAECNNTTQASAGSGALTTIDSDGFNIQGGYQYLPVPEDRIPFLPAEAIIVSITAPADAITLSGTARVEEII